jgi:hypothetical protein
MKIRLAMLAGAFLVMTMLATPALLADTYQVRLFNTDDVLNAYLTNSNVTSLLVAHNTYGLDTGLVDITALVAPGTNTLDFNLDNLVGGYAWGVQVYTNTSTLLYQTTCGTQGVVGCNNNDQTLFTNRPIGQFQFNVANANVPEPDTIVLMFSGLAMVVLMRRGLRFVG